MNLGLVINGLGCRFLTSRQSFGVHDGHLLKVVPDLCVTVFNLNNIRLGKAVVIFFRLITTVTLQVDRQSSLGHAQAQDPSWMLSRPSTPAKIFIFTPKCKRTFAVSLQQFTREPAPRDVRLMDIQTAAATLVHQAFWCTWRVSLISKLPSARKR